MSGESASDSVLPSEAGSHYRAGVELGRLSRGSGRLERLRTQEILQHHLPEPPAVVVDVGGGPGLYACWLAAQGYEVHLIDAMPLHIEQAEAASRAQPSHPIASLEVGDARRLGRSDGSADAVLLLGPLYHLTGRQGRLAALREARRILKPGGVLFAAGISRFASALDGLKSGFLDDPVFRSIVERDLTDGQHRNPTNHPYYFTTAFFHHPAELRQEIEEAALDCERMLAVEGVAWLLQNFDVHWDDPVRRERLLHVVRRMEDDPSVLGVSAHMMAVARRKIDR